MKAEREGTARRASAEPAAPDHVLAALLEASPSGVLLVDARGRITLVNRECERMFGYSRDELIGREVELLVPTAVRVDHVTWRETYAQAPVARAMGTRTDLCGRHCDGSDVPVEVALTPLHLNGSGVVLVTVLDVTIRRDAERRLASTLSELARSNDDLQQFAYATSHDLQAPLRSVAGFLDLLLEGHGEQLAPDAARYVGLARAAAERMRRLIEDLLELARVGHGDETRGTVDLGDVLTTVRENLRNEIEEAGAEFQWENLPTVTADRTRMVQLFQNLVSNAFAFAGDAAPAVRVTARTRGADHEIRVEDHGIGIPAEQLERVFGVFQRLRPRGERGGNGIGLAICKRIVERHGGRIRAESAPGTGTTLVVTLPRGDRHRAERRLS